MFVGVMKFKKDPRRKKEIAEKDDRPIIFWQDQPEEVQEVRMLIMVMNNPYIQSMGYGLKTIERINKCKVEYPDYFNNSFRYKFK